MIDILQRLHCTIRCDSETAASGCHCAEARDEITRLRNELHIAEGWSARVIAGHEEDISEITGLRAENERLRAALRKIVHDWEIPQDDNWKRVFRSVWEIARAAIAAQPAPSPWRSIETAPRDGTEVLMVFVFEDGEVLHRVVRWDASEMWPWRDEYTGYREREAKGWMPLPIPPPQEPRT